MTTSCLQEKIDKLQNTVHALLHKSNYMAGTIPSLLPLGTLFLTPLFGNVYDRIGKGATLMIIGSVLLVLFSQS